MSEHELKAKKLVDKFFPSYCFNPWNQRQGYAIKYALLCVDEIIENINGENGAHIESQKSDWERVRKEIQKLEIK